METGYKTIMQTSPYWDSVGSIRESLENLQVNDDIRGKIASYLEEVDPGDTDKTVDRKDPRHQGGLRGAQKLLQAMIEAGYLKEAELIFNVHRVFTEFRGYGASESASSDVEACFGEGVDIPEEGVIVVDRFVTRNLPEIIDILEARGLDLGRLRIRCPQMLLAAQFQTMSIEKIKEFTDAARKLNADQFLIEDVASCHDIALPEGEEIAVHFTPRTLPFRLDWHGDAGEFVDWRKEEVVEAAEEKTIEKYCEWVRAEVAQLVPGGRVFMNIAKVPEFGELSVTLESARKGGRELAKPTQQISNNVAEAIVKCLIEEGMMDLVQGLEDKPVEDYDHSKAIKSGHWRKPVEVEPGDNSMGDWHTNIAS